MRISPFPITRPITCRLEGRPIEECFSGCRNHPPLHTLPSTPVSQTPRITGLLHSSRVRSQNSAVRKKSHTHPSGRPAGPSRVPSENLEKVPFSQTKWSHSSRVRSQNSAVRKKTHSHPSGRPAPRMTRPTTSKRCRFLIPNGIFGINFAL